MALQPGARLGPYEIVDLIGSGGMGEVYRARDCRLHRIVAVKVLPAAFCDDPWRRVRFQREAHAISTLNHHRICALYDIGEEDGTPYLVMELLTGEPLNALLQKGPLPIWRALRIGSEIAEGLAAAHKHGIVHRDLKPANVMLTPEGVKLLDFGLAKLSEPEPGVPEDRPTGRLDSLSQDGFVVGSLPYMAPEQLSGKTVDARADIWALGVILYEMVAGWRPFSSDSTTGLAASILEHDPERLSAVRHDTPAPLERVVAGCLEKNPDDRWYSAHDVAYELTGLTPPTAVPVALPLPPHPWWRRSTWRVGTAAALFATVTLVVALPPVRPPPSGPAATPSGVRTAGTAGGLLINPRPLTSAPGWEAHPALSPDGSLVAYVSNESGQPDLWIVGIGGTNAIRLTNDEALEEKPCWHPDGRWLAYVSNRGDAGRAIWKVPVLGGTPSLLLSRATDPAIDPSGTRMAFVSTLSERVAVVSLDNLGDSIELTHADDGFWNHRDPAWSPDGSRIAYAAQRGLWTVPAAGGDATPLTTDDEADDEPAWSPDGRYVYFKSMRHGTDALWRVPATGGDPERVTLGSGPESHPHFSRAGPDLVFTTLRRDPDIVVRDLQSGTEVAWPNARAEYMPAFSPDGRQLLFVSMRGDQPRIWQQRVVNGRPGAAPAALTEHQGAYPSYSPDGRWIAYYRFAKGKPRTIWLLPSGGGPSLKLLPDAGRHELYPSWSPDGRQLAFVTKQHERSELHVIGIRDGQPVAKARTLLSGQTEYETPVWSPDGRSLAVIEIAPGAAAVWTIGTDGGQPAERIATSKTPLRVRWHPRTGRMLVSTQRGPDVELFDVGPPDGVLRPLSPRIVFGGNPELRDFDISPDGRWLTFCRETAAGDIWLAEVLTPVENPGTQASNTERKR